MSRYLRKIKRRNYVILALVITGYLFTRVCASCNPSTQTSAIRDNDGKLFAGSSSCQSCHKEIYKSHIQTAHYRDSRPAAKEYIKGSFDSGRNRFVYNSSAEVIMEHKGNGLFQTAFVNGKESRSEPFDIVIGSGKKGQTYLWYDNDGKLFQLPVSYYTPSGAWCNSPGYSTDSIRFNRRVPAYCLECHGTYARTIAHSSPDFGDEFDKSQIIYGVDCERCHGPAAGHISFHRAHPGERTGRFIVNTKLLSRQQRLDACALCHSGRRVQLKPAFNFVAGDKLNDFSISGGLENSPTLDVHANQYGLLLSSKCFQRSQMDCSSCHNSHVNEAGNLQVFSQRCMNCHQESSHNSCTMAPDARSQFRNNCIDCHMPALPSQKIVVQLSGAGNSIPNLVRTHHIAIYPVMAKE